MIGTSRSAAGLWVERLALTTRNVIPAKAGIRPNRIMRTSAACTDARLRGHDEFAAGSVFVPKSTRI